MRARTRVRWVVEHDPEGSAPGWSVVRVVEESGEQGWEHVSAESFATLNRKSDALAEARRRRRAAP